MTQQRAVRTRELILDAAAEEFAAHGYVAATLLGVVERTGMTKGALYGHFSSKEELAAALIKEAGDELAACAARRGGPTLQTLRKITLDLARQVRQDTRARSALRLAVEAPHLDRHSIRLVERICLSLTRAVAEAQAGHQAGGSRPPESIAQLLMSVFAGVPHPVPRDDADAARRFDDLWKAMSEPPRDGVSPPA